MSLGKVALRATLGSFFIGHGTQKLFGWFGGHGLEGTAGFFEGQLGLRPGKRHATMAGVGEAAGGALLILGAFTPVAAALITGAMTTAIRKVHAQNGPWVTDSGYEYNAVIIAALAALNENSFIAAGSVAAGVAGSYLVTEQLNEAPAEEKDETDDTAAQANGVPQAAGAPA